MSVLARMVASPAAAQWVLAALAGEHEGNVLSDVPGALGSLPSDSTQAILDAALGERRGVVEVRIARSAGIDPTQGRAVLAASATLLLGALGHAQRLRRWSSDELARTLAGELMLAEDAVPGSVGVLEELSEAAADAEIGDDVIEVGAQLLTRLCDS